MGDEVLKETEVRVAVSLSCDPVTVYRQEFYHIFHDPAAYNAVIRQNQRRYCRRYPAEGSKMLVYVFVCTDNTFTGFSSDSYFGYHESEAECYSKYEVDEQEDSAAVLSGKIRESPYVSQSDGRTGCRENESDF